MDGKYQRIYKKVKTQLRKCRDRDIRVKAELILLGLKLGNVSEACSRRGFSRKFYYKWFKRLQQARWDISALAENSRRPKHSPGVISKELDKAIQWYAKRGYGTRMIEAMLAREGLSVSKSTIAHVLNKRTKPKKKRKHRLKKHRRRYELASPGERLQLDVKYVPKHIAGGYRAFNYVAVDECTRWRFSKAYLKLDEESTEDFLRNLKQACPFPIECIQTDNGIEFTFRLNPHVEREHSMDVWCKQNNIRHRCIPPGEKELNGKVERSHRIDMQYFYWKADYRSLGCFNKSQEKWLRKYNEERPHGGLQYQTPKEKLKKFGIKLEKQKPKKKTKLEQLLDNLDKINAA